MTCVSFKLRFKASFLLYISRLVKTRIPHSGLLIHCHSGSILSLASHLYLSSTSSYSTSLSSHPFLHLDLLLVYLSGSAVTPSHTQGGPSVAIPSVRVSSLSHLRVASTSLRPSRTYARQSVTLRPESHRGAATNNQTTVGITGPI
jgi:hypothetical protein